MTTRRKPQKAPLAHADAPKPLAPCDARSRSYPRLADLVREPALAGVLRSAVLGGAALSALALSGCEAPECQATRLDEVRTHTGQALSLLGELAVKRSAVEVTVGLGLTPHPAVIMLGGAMPMVTLPPPPSAPPSIAAPSGPAIPE